MPARRPAACTPAATAPVPWRQVGLRRHVRHPVPLGKATAVDRDEGRRRRCCCREDAVEEENEVDVGGGRQVEPCLRRQGDVVRHPRAVAAAG